MLPHLRERTAENVRNNVTNGEWISRQRPALPNYVASNRVETILIVVPVHVGSVGSVVVSIIGRRACCWLEKSGRLLGKAEI